jgi:two-component system, OmpR family, sensor histidine kinase MtrB
MAFALLALLLSVSLALMTYGLTRRYLISKRETSATQEAVANAHAIARYLGDRPLDPATILVNLSTVGSSRSVVHVGARWFAASSDIGRSSIPVQLQSLHGDRILRQRVAVSGATAIVVAVPIRPNIGVYYDVFPLTELRSTLRTLGIVLMIAAVIVTLLGAALGRVASRRLLRPLQTMADTAVRIASGNRESRLETADADLAPFIHAFNDMVDALEERVDRETRFASDVSHELRTPLTAIRAAVDVLERQIDYNARSTLAILRRQTERFEQLVLDLLEISRFNAGTIALVVETVDPTRLVRSVLQRTGNAAVPVVIDPTAPASVQLDRRRIERALTNLVDNANHYAGGATQIRVAGTCDALEIAVDDAGPGVAPAERELVFERFHRGDTSRASSAPGTGLGLAIAAEDCRLHGGRLTVSSSPEGGARFLIELPQEPA